jgi:uncharacterized RDD family membrane protein YckC
MTTLHDKHENMNPPEAQSDSAEETRFDPDALDLSEQQFSASLQTSAEGTGFVVDSHEASRVPGAADLDEVDDRASRSSFADAGERNGAAGGGDDLEGDSRALPSGELPTQPDWRNLVSAKVEKYKARKPRKEHYPSLQLPFDPVLAWRAEGPSRPAADDRRASPPLASARQQPSEAEGHLFLAPSTESTARVLEFPRPGTLPFNREELAEPVVDRPRIVEAPELLPPPPALGGISMAPVDLREPERQAGLDMPLKTARLSRKLLATAIDGVLVTAALTIFGYVFLRFNPALPPLRTTAELAAMLLGSLWLLYQSAFIVFCGTTPGLRSAHLKIAQFDGTPAGRKLRRWRVLVSLLSCASLGLGYAWCFFDEDQLSWHDRITRTHLAPRT